MNDELEEEFENERAYVFTEVGGLSDMLHNVIDKGDWTREFGELMVKGQYEVAGLLFVKEVRQAGSAKAEARVRGLK